MSTGPNHSILIEASNLESVDEIVREYNNLKGVHQKLRELFHELEGRYQVQCEDNQALRIQMEEQVQAARDLEAMHAQRDRDTAVAHQAKVDELCASINQHRDEYNKEHAELEALREVHRTLLRTTRDQYRPELDELAHLQTVIGSLRTEKTKIECEKNDLQARLTARTNELQDCGDVWKRKLALEQQRYDDAERQHREQQAQAESAKKQQALLMDEQRRDAQAAQRQQQDVHDEKLRAVTLTNTDLFEQNERLRARIVEEQTGRQRDVGRVQSDVEAIRNAMNHLIAEKQQLANQLNICRAGKAEAKATNDTLTRELHEMRAQYETVRAACSAGNERERECRSKVEKTADENAAYRREVEKLSNQINEERHLHLVNLQQHRGAWSSEKETALRKIGELKLALSAQGVHRETIVRLEYAQEHANITIADLKSTIASLEQHIAALKQRVRDSDARTAQMCMQLSQPMMLKQPQILSAADIASATRDVLV